jgi:hypothetical protein
MARSHSRLPQFRTPSDFDGVVYIGLDDQGAWKLAVAREVQAAGFEVDMNKATGV